MTSVASSGTSPHPSLEQFHAGGDFIPGDDESWAFISPQGVVPSNPSSVGFFSSPDTGSLRSFGIVGRHRGGSAAHSIQPSPPAPSPLFLDHDGVAAQQQQQGFVMQLPSDQGSFVDQHQQGGAASSSAFGDHGSSSFADHTDPFSDQGSFLDQMGFADQVVAFPPRTTGPADSQFASPAAAESIITGRFYGSDEFSMESHDMQDFASYLAFQTISPQAGPATSLESPASMNPSPQALEIPMLLPQTDLNAAPWNPTAIRPRNESLVFRMEEFLPPTAPTPVTLASTSSPARSSASPVSPVVKQEPGLKPNPSLLSSSSSSSSAGAAATNAIRKVKNSRVEKRRSPTDSSLASGAGSLSSSAGSSGSEVSLKFITISSETAAASGGKGNMFECFDRMTQRGRKGPLADATKENALQVRRVGACFCCHARKVKCDAQRPCKNCKKLTMQMPQIVCWQFQDFLGILFPEMPRAHFSKEQMATFIAENVREFRIDGAERPCIVELTSGSRFATTLTIPAKAFTASNPDILRHYRQEIDVNGNAILNVGIAAPIGLDAEGGMAQKDDLRKRAREYISSIVREPCFADETTASIRTTQLPREVLRIVQTYALRSQSDIVKKALTIYANNYVLTRHLDLTANGIARLARAGLVTPNEQVQTSRLLNRQLKAVLDEINQREMQLAFEAFSKMLKPKMRKDWAPCTAAFILLALFMEEVEISLDVFGVAQNEVNRSRGRAFQYDRKQILALNREIENMPFRQFAFQFHQTYQTHSTDASTKPFNPLVDDSLVNEQYLDAPAIEMVRSLRQLIWDAETGSELDFLSGQAADDNIILDNRNASHPYPMDLSMIYSGRLMAKFLLSFTRIQYLLDP